MKICVFYKRGKCKKGNECDMWHPPPCRLFEQGKCLLGRKCSFLHPRSEPAAAAVKAEDEPGAKAKAKAHGKTAVQAAERPSPLNP